jgi:DNA polymerase I-like protein with 3'-5' exonuclease and polymerase domains
MIKEEVTDIFTLEMELCPILIDMTMRGIRFDRENAGEIHNEMKQSEENCWHRYTPWLGCMLIYGLLPALPRPLTSLA